jgi:hypothetical protein
MRKIAENIGFDVQALTPFASQSVAYTATSAQSTALDLGTRIVRLCSTTDAYVEIGTNPTATTSSMYLPALSVEYFAIPDGTYKVAAKQVSSAGSISVAEMR